MKATAGLSVALDPGPTIDDQNAAFARSGCTDCRTVAVAVQVVVMEGPVSDFRPENAAVALNDNCVRGQTMAYARQEVLATDRHVPLSDGAQSRIEAIEQQIRSAAWSLDSFDQITADLDVLTAQLVAVVQEAPAEAGTSASDTSRRHVDRHED